MLQEFLVILASGFFSKITVSNMGGGKKMLAIVRPTNFHDIINFKWKSW